MRTGRSSPQGLQLPLLCDATDSVSRHREGRVRRFDSDANTDAKTRQEDQHGYVRPAMSNLHGLLRRGYITREEHETEVAALQTKLR